MRAHASRGFTVIEMLVTVAILAAVLIPIMEATAAVTRRHVRQAQELELLETRRAALTMLREVNPMAEPDGRRVVAGNRQMRWHAEPISTRTRALRFLGGEGRFEVALYRLTVDLPRGRPLVVEALGWRDTQRLDRPGFGFRR